MSEQKRVLLLPGPRSAEAAEYYFGAGKYEFGSYLTDDYFSGAATYITNGKLKQFAGRAVDVWSIPPRRRREELSAGLESVLRQLIKLDCTLRVVAMTEEDEQYDPHVCRAIDMSADQFKAWARAHIRPVELPPEVPRETKRGKPRSRPDGGAPEARVIDGNTGSVFVSWEQLGLATGSNGAPHTNLANASRVIANHPELVGKIWYDEFHEKVFQTLFQETPEEWHDTHDTRMAIWMQERLRLPKMGHQTIRLAVEDYARQNVHNEVREWMDSLAWDHTERLPRLFTRAFGTADNEYNATVGRCWFVSMAARTYEPGCKVDTMPVFEGIQGLRKSSALAAIGGKWYSEMHEDITTKDFLQNLRGNLLIEISELHAFRKAEVKRIKGIISCPSDRYRESYGRRAANHPRRSVFAGTTNDDDYNTDDTGARRFWPARCGSIDLDYLRRNREQLFAEAVFRFKATEPWWDIDPDLAAAEQNERRDDDEWTPQILSYCATHGEVTVGEILNDVLVIPMRDWGKSEQMRVASILKRAGFKRATQWRGSRMVKIWLTIKK